MLNSAELANYMVMNTIGMSILVETLRYAATYLSHYSSNGFNGGYRDKRSYVSKKESEECFAFVRGTGLETLLVEYDLGYNADRIRSTFFTMLNARNYIE